MSFCCTKHGWQHLQNPCPSCNISVPLKGVSQIYNELGAEMTFNKQKSLEEKYLSLVEKYVALAEKYVALSGNL